jgi:ABC-2 type transport system permease protein
LVAGVATLIWLVVQGETNDAGYVAFGAGLLALIVWLTGTIDGFEDAFARLGVESHFYGFGEGLVRLGDVVYFVGIAGVVLYLCTFMLGRRHW